MAASTVTDSEDCRDVRQVVIKSDNELLLLVYRCRGPVNTTRLSLLFFEDRDLRTWLVNR